MPNLTLAARIKCPYFLRLNGKSVICEGLVPGSEIANCFSRGKELLGWVAEVCESYDYVQGCLLARAVEGKYEEEGGGSP